MSRKIFALFVFFLLVTTSINPLVFADDSDQSESDDFTSAEEQEPDEEDDEDDEDDEDSNMEDAAEKIKNAEEEIAEAEEVISEKETEGKNVSSALERLESAKTLLGEAQIAYSAGSYEEAEELARDAKHEAMYAKGKDIQSNSEESVLGQEFGECISEAAKLGNDNKHDEFEACFEEFKEKVSEFVEGKLSEEDQNSNQSFDEALSSLAEGQDSAISALLLDLRDFNVSGIDEGDVLEDIEAALNSEDSLNEKLETLEDIIEDIKKESTKKKFEDGVIPFKDTDDEDWYFNFVDQMESEACISGYKDQSGNELGEFLPGNQVLFGESLKFVVECILDEDPLDITEGDFWARAYALKLHEDFSDLLSADLLARIEKALVDDTEYNTQMTRGELIQLIVDVLGLDVQKAKSSPFNDVSLSHANVNAINHALLAGVISGDEESGTFRPDEVPNRAEVAKIIILAKQLF